MDMNFNGFTVTQLFDITDVRIKTMPSANVRSKEVPMRNGSIFQGVTLGEREIEVDIHLMQDYLTQFDDDGTPKSSVYNNYIRSIVYYLQTDEPKKLVFSDEPDRYYWAICTDIEINRLFQLGEGTITFICNDPYAYAVEEKEILDTTIDGKFLIDNYGTAEAFPKVRIELQEDTHYVACISPEGVVQVGSTEQEESQSSSSKVYKDDLPDLTNWSKGSQALLPPDGSAKYIFDDAIEVYTTGEVMRPRLTQYEESANDAKDYKGTHYITTLPSDNQSKYFQARLQFDFECTNRNQCGINEIILYDINNTIIGRFSFRDYNKNLELPQPFAYLGASNLVWKPTISAPKPTTKRYTKVFESEDEIPTDATVINKYERTTAYATVHVDVANAPVFKGSVVTYKYVKQGYEAQERYYDKSAKKYKYRTVTKYKQVKVENPIKRLEQGSEYRIKSSKSGWYCIYLNSKRTSVGWIQSKYVTKEDAETETVYVYERKIYTEKVIGSYGDWWGYWLITRKPHNNKKGDIWQLELYRLDKKTSKAKRVWYKTISDSTGTKYTSAGKLAKIGVFFGAYGNNSVMTDLSFNYLSVKTLDKNYNESNYHLIGTKGDIIEIDYAIPMVELNGEPIMYEVDIGSQFNPIQPFMQTEFMINTDAETIGAKVILQERYL